MLDWMQVMTVTKTRMATRFLSWVRLGGDDREEEKTWQRTWVPFGPMKSKGLGGCPRGEVSRKH